MRNCALAAASVLLLLSTAVTVMAQQHQHPVELPLDIYEVSSKGEVYTIPPATKNYKQLYAQLTTYGALAGLDYDSTQRGLRKGGREANPFLSDANGNLYVGRYVVLNAAAGAGIALVGRFVAPKLPRGPRRVVNGLVWAMLGGRAVVVVQNYQKGNK